MSFGRFLLAFFCSPIYFALRGRWGMFAIHLPLYLSAIVTVIVGFGVLLWLLGAGHAIWDLARSIREREMRRQADLIAEKMGSGQPGA